MGGPQGRFGRGGEEKQIPLFLLIEIQPHHPAGSLVTIPIELNNQVKKQITNRLLQK
jgi:hypothetical protein